MYEFLLSWNISNRSDIIEFVWRNSLDHFFGRNSFRVPHSGYVRGLITLLCYKFGGQQPLKEIAKHYRGDNDIEFIRYAFCCLAGTDDFREEAFQKAAIIENMSIRRLEKLIHDLEENAIEYKEFLSRLLKPRMRKFPTRFKLEARALPIFRISRRDKNFKKQMWHEIVEEALRNLKQTPEKLLQDEVSIDFLEREVCKP